MSLCVRSYPTWVGNLPRAIDTLTKTLVPDLREPLLVVDHGSPRNSPSLQKYKQSLLPLVAP